MRELLKTSVQAFGVRLSEQTLDKFGLYFEMLSQANAKFNLTAITEPRAVAVKHFADSLAAADLLPQGCSLCDVGSGAGFPGIPLKLARPDIQLTMLDSLNKRVGFLNEVAARLELSETRALHVRAEDAGRDSSLRERFDIVTARAVAELRTLLEYALPLVKPGGRFVAYKGSASEEIAAAASALKALGGRVEEVREYSLGDMAEQRSLVIVKKTSPTPSQYPRGRGKERSAPL